MMKVKHNYLEDLKYDLKLIAKDIEEIESIIGKIEDLSTLEEYLNCDFISANVTLEELYENFDRIYSRYENDEISLDEVHDLILEEVKQDWINYYSDNAKWNEYQNNYISLYALQDNYSDKKGELDNTEQKIKEILDIIELIPAHCIKDIETSRKSISTYIECYTKDYPVIIEKISALVDNDEIDNALGTEFEFNEKYFTIRISDHETGSYFDEELGYHRNYLDGEISIIL